MVLADSNMEAAKLVLSSTCQCKTCSTGPNIGASHDPELSDVVPCNRDGQGALYGGRRAMIAG